MNDFWTQAFRQLKADRFRTLLSLLGVAIGIFSIVAASLLTFFIGVQRLSRRATATPTAAASPCPCCPPSSLKSAIRKFSSTLNSTTYPTP